MAGWTTWRDVPVGEQNYLSTLVDVWEQTIGFQVAINTAQLLDLANAGIQTQHDLGQYAAQNWSGGNAWDGHLGAVLKTMPWALYGLDKDTYAAMAGTFGTEYKKITGQEIDPQALHQAFQNPRDQTGGLLTASQYAQQLMNDTAIQKTYGWVKYGLDFSQWTQQKLQLQSAFGRSVNDSEAATMLQYDKAAAGSNLSATARAGGQQQQQAPAVGVAGSVVR